jgi:hypothetical protein
MRASGLTLTLLLFSMAVAATQAAAQESAATYAVQLSANSPTRLAVRATVPRGDALKMSPSRPGDVPELADAGWPALVRNLVVLDGDGRALAPAPAGAQGWTLPEPGRGPYALSYEVDYAPLAARGWPAWGEAAFADENHLVVIGRSLFITSPAQGVSTVRFGLPAGWHAAAPWPPDRVASPDDLTENLLAFTRGKPEVLATRGFRLTIVPLGPWQGARGEVRGALGKLMRELVALTGFDGRADYLAVMMPQADRGAQSFRASFALNHDEPPSRANVGAWGNLVAHELLHYWNGWRLKGAEYAATQWFQEGFTEYGANLAMVGAGLVTDEQFNARLARHVATYRRLATPLDAPGTSKGPPLYSGGALVAFTWDGLLREATGGRRGYADVLRGLLRRTDGGARPYAWPDILAVLEALAPGAWAEFHARHVHGTEPLPLDAAFARVGLQLSQDAAGAPVVAPDPAAPAAARRRGDALLRGAGGR